MPTINSRCRDRFLLALAVLVWAGGCESAPRAATVDAPKARDVLRTTLEAWKSGKRPDDLTKASPPVTAQDLDWVGGAALLDYQIIGEGTPDDANLRVPVELKLRDSSGREVSRKVSYVVGTSPSITVFREL